MRPRTSQLCSTPEYPRAGAVHSRSANLNGFEDIQTHIEEGRDEARHAAAGVVHHGFTVLPADIVYPLQAVLKSVIVARETFLTVTVPAMRTTIEALRVAGVRDKVRIMIGGAPVTSRFSESIGADEYSESAGAAVVLARSLMTSTKEITV